MSVRNELPSWSSAVAAVLFAVSWLSLPVRLGASAPSREAVGPAGSRRSHAGGDSGGGRAARAAARPTPAVSGQRDGDQSAWRDVLRPSAAGGSAVRRAPASDDRRANGSTRAAARRDRGNSGDSGTSNRHRRRPVEHGSDLQPPARQQPGDRHAVERQGRPPVTGDGGTTVWVPGGYYGGYYPWGYGGFGLGGYYGGYYDPWYYGDSHRTTPATTDYDYDGRLRLKVKPRERRCSSTATTSGLVDEFDGMFQRLHIEPGPHRIEIRADGYEPLVFDVRIHAGPHGHLHGRAQRASRLRRMQTEITYRATRSSAVRSSMSEF